MTDHLNNRLLRTINRMNDVPEGIKSIIDVELESVDSRIFREKSYPRY